MPRPGDYGLSLGHHKSAQLEKATSNCVEPEPAGVSSVSGPGLAQNQSVYEESLLHIQKEG